MDGLEMLLVTNELRRLVDDYYLCRDPKVKYQIKCDIVLLSNAVYLSDREHKKS